MGKSNKRKTHEKYLNELKEKEITITPLENYVDAKTKILHKCNKCKNEWTSKPNNILSGYGCPACAGNITIDGLNDLWTTNIETASLLFNPDDGHKYSKYSSKKVDWICPDCGSIIKNRAITNITQQGLRCDRCSDGISIPNKFICNILDHLGIEFETEKSFKWIYNRRYDVYINSINCIIEMHGGGHYFEAFKFENCRSYNEEHENDRYKQLEAEKNNIENYIVVDARYSDLDWIKNSILNSKLTELIDLSSVDWDYCFKKSMKSNLIISAELWNQKYTVTEISKMLHLSNTTISTYLNKATRLNLCSYLGVKNKLVKVICLSTGDIFNSLLEAKDYFDMSSSAHIINCCKGKRKSAGKDFNGKPLRWMYYNDYIKLNNNESSNQ